MKTGIEYARSDEKRAFDLIMAAALTPAAFASRLVLGYEIRKHIGDNESPIFLQQRRGADGEPFTIRKLLTLDKDSDVSYNRFVHFFRRFGLDELPQVKNIRDNQMSLVAPRALEPWLETKVLNAANPDTADEWMDVVWPEKRGIISPFAIVNHQHPDLIVPLADVKCRSDINLIRHGSLVNDAALVGQAIGAVLTGRL